MHLEVSHVTDAPPCREIPNRSSRENHSSKKTREEESLDVPFLLALAGSDCELEDMGIALRGCRYSRTRLITLLVTVEPPFLGQFEYKSVMHKGSPKEFVRQGGNGGIQRNVRARHPGA
eukprot:3719948-Rhodomonas_salina.1